MSAKSGGRVEEADQQNEIFKIRKLIKGLEVADGSGTSLISLIIPPGDSIDRHRQKLNDEYAAASNIKSHSN
jgi:peptide chain release factor subunit 1